MRTTIRQAGFTLVEMMVVVVITGFVSTAMFQMLQAGQATYERNKIVLDVQQNGRVGLQTIADDMRQVSYGKDPTQPSIHYAGPDSVTFVADIMHDEPGAEVISYYLGDDDPETPNPYDTVLMRTVADTAGTVLMETIQTYGVAANGLSFRWFNGSGVELSNPVPQPEQVGEVYIELQTVGARLIDEEYPTLTLSTTIYPRNLPLSPARSRPNTPACTGPSYPNCESAQLDWSTPTYNTDGTELPLAEISHFNFYFGTDPDDMGLYTRLARTINEWTVPDLEAGITYYLAVSCVSRSGVESYPCTRQAVVGSALVPQAPASLSASTAGGVTLNWDIVTEFTNGDGIGTPVSYNIYRSDTAGFTPGTTNFIDTVSWTTTYVDTETSGITCGTYYYLVTAEACGNEGAPSPEANGSLPAPPSCPTNVYATNTGVEGEVFVSWNLPATRLDGSSLDPNDIEYIYIYADTASGMPNEFYGVVPGNETSTTIPYLATCTTYYFNVKAVDVCGHEGDMCLGEEVSLFTSAPCDPDAPQTPAYLSVTEYDSKMKLEWPANDVDCDLQGYRIYYGHYPGDYSGTNAYEGPSPIEVTTDAVTYGNLCEFELTGLPTCTNYYVQVTAIDQCSPPNESSASSEGSGTTSCISCNTTANCILWTVSGGSNNELNIELEAGGATELLAELTPDWSGGASLQEVWFGRPLAKIWDYDGSAGGDGYTGPAGPGTVLDVDDVYVGSWTNQADGEPLTLVFDTDVRDVPVNLQFTGDAGSCTADGSGVGSLDFQNWDSGTSGWSSQSGNWFTSNYELHQTYTGSNYIMLMDGPDRTDLTFETKVMASGGSYHSSYLVFRYADSSNYYLFGIRTDANKVRLARIQNGSFIETGVHYTTLSDNTWYTLRVVVEGNRIRGFFDCELVLDITDSSMYSSGDIGLTTRRAAGRFDDTRVFSGAVIP